ncbi:uncharacterized protein E0L32_011016 [Thyridium curvatum]|uniref:Uncharacterized protein n=1 Tax=Thyridium curvatum TaxID=1093900 RepID=A0A507AQ82_9PEZI|nr:uncharacterized protein E0L32_011016 [Thyridium curvatum]TPX07028.1 hypothetical protein E0L32_011016 [Thyridium curvatum]
MSLAFYAFVFGPSSPLYQNASSTRGRFTHPSATHRPSGYRAASWGGDNLKNRVFFTFVFVEAISWFWIWVTLKEERREILTRKAMKRRGSHGHTPF